MFGRKVMRWRRDCIVAGIFWIVKADSGKRAGLRVTGNDVQVDVSILILQKSVVEMIRLER